MAPSVWGMPCAALSSKGALQKELANPLVAPFIDFYPEDPQGHDQFKLSQCQRWLEMPSNTRPQMCVNNTKHYYIFEPVQTHSSGIVVPVFLYTLNSKLCAKCIRPIVENPFRLVIPGAIQFSDSRLLIIKVKDFCHEYAAIQIAGQLLSILCENCIFEEHKDHLRPLQLPNPWRTKAGGKIIRNVPITLYSDDTSGNVSKRWNKHVSFYFTLSGLPPRISNQEFNCHFLTTSNRAGVLELSEMVINELNSITKDGCEEVTNTPMPNTSLNPCRICQLSVPSQDQKHSKQYLRNFLQIDEDGYKRLNTLRGWKKLIEATYDLFDIGFYSTLKEHERMGKFYGVKDRINEKFIENKKDKSVQEKVKNLLVEDPTRLFNPFLKLEGTRLFPFHHPSICGLTF
ncbi:hypothetical protein PCASD_02459 [Puccinia coronata f. sp. avenae]|uniref:Uncharacterized protein n=1 Tax=Puccinia coronata f. sp. avenae TaxID=200324 RepID=A0A2N5VM82_9BASI|nr:hypothetical protein PCASD_02459 [Puccinia coronata f. sp. avenae]